MPPSTAPGTGPLSGSRKLQAPRPPLSEKGIWSRKGAKTQRNAQQSIAERPRRIQCLLEGRIYNMSGVMDSPSHRFSRVVPRMLILLVFPCAFHVCAQEIRAPDLRDIGTGESVPAAGVLAAKDLGL